MDGSDKTNELLKTLLIVQLGMAGVPQQKIRAIVGGKLSRVTKILKLITAKKSKKEK
jgi:hypothetical protein